MIDRADITERAAAAVFAHPRQRKIVLSLVGQELSLSELSVITATPLNLLHHHVAKLLRLGLVEVTRSRPRAGAAVKYYRATAASFFVPAELAATAPGENMSSRLRAALARGLAKDVLGYAYSHDGTGPRMRLVRDPDRRATTAELWVELRLTPAEAAELAAEFRTLLKRFEARSAPAGQRYIVHAALAATSE